MTLFGAGSLEAFPVRALLQSGQDECSSNLRGAQGYHMLIASRLAKVPLSSRASDGALGHDGAYNNRRKNFRRSP